LVQDSLVHPPQVWSGFDSEIIHEPISSGAEGCQRLTLLARSVLGEHEERPPSFCPWSLNDQRREFGGDRPVLAQIQPGFQQVVLGTSSDRLQAGYLGLGRRLVFKIAVGVTAPQPGCATQCFDSSLEVRTRKCAVPRLGLGLKA
jgi:hypothetical protein